jgi:hypothetical protein
MLAMTNENEEEFAGPPFAVLVNGVVRTEGLKSIEDVEIRLVELHAMIPGVRLSACDKKGNLIPRDMLMGLPENVRRRYRG